LQDQILQKPECEEFAENGLDEQGRKLGFDPLHPKCIFCRAKLICMELGAQKPKEDRIDLIRNELGLKYFYDENKIKELGVQVLDRIENQLRAALKKGVEVTEVKLDAIISSLVDKTLQSTDPKIPGIIKEVLLERGIKIENGIVTV
jgi:hypothetical protein